MRLIVLLLVAASCTPATRGWSQTVIAGLHFSDERTTAIVAIEIAAVAHEELDARPAPAQAIDGLPMIEIDDRWPHRHLGAQVTGGTGIALDRGGASSITTVGVDYLPFVYDTQSVVGMGGQFLYSAGARDGIAGVTRLWFAVPVTSSTTAPLLAGLMLRGQFGPDGNNGGGPVLVLTRSQL